jgi:cytochrome P450
MCAYFCPLDAGLVVSSGHRWKQHAGLIRPLFHRSKMTTMLPAMFDEAKHFVSEMAARRSDAQRHEFVSKELMNTYALNMTISKRSVSEQA